MRTGIDFYIHDDVVIKDSQAKFGSHVAVDKGFYCTTRIRIGNYVHIGPYCTVIGSLESGLHMKDFSFMSAGCKVVAGSDDFSESNLMGPLIPEHLKKINISDIIFEKYSGLGTNCTILNGITLAEGSIVCASSTVTKDTKPWTVYAGTPARPIRIRDRKKVLQQEKQLLREINENQSS